MKTYITTNKHPELKEGLILEETAYNSELFILNTCMVQLPLESDLSIEQWLEKGYIMEAGEKEFNRMDIVDLMNYAYNKQKIYAGSNIKELIDNWLKERS